MKDLICMLDQLRWLFVGMGIEHARQELLYGYRNRKHTKCG